MDVVRITELQPKTYVEQGDYIAIDNQSDGTKKVQFTNLLDDTLSQENKIAPANIVGNEIATIRAAVGSPLKASTVAQMTDTNKIYVYVGSESGYINGNWYYWNGSAWTSGGVYNSVAVVTDPTLTLSGVPADAKATGDEVTNLKSDLNSAVGLVQSFTISDWVDNVYVDTSSGNFIAYNGWHRSDYIEIGTDVTTLNFKNNKSGQGITPYNCFYDADHNKVGTNFNTTASGADVTVPDDAKYFVVSIESTYTVSVVRSVVTLTERAIKTEVESQFADISKSVSNLLNGRITFDLIDGSYVEENGVITPYATYSRTDYIDIEAYSYLETYHTTGAASRYNCFYDSSKTFISSFSTDAINVVRKIEVPQNAKYVIFSADTPYMNTLQITPYPSAYQTQIAVKDITEEDGDALINSSTGVSLYPTNGYIQTNDGAFIANNSYQCYSFTMPKTANVWYENPQGWNELAVFNDNLFDTDDLVAIRTSSASNLPTVDHSLKIEAGKVVALCVPKDTGFTLYIGNEHYVIKGVATKPKVIITPIYDSVFTVDILDEGSDKYLKHWFRHNYYTKTVQYGNNQSKEVVCGDIWFCTDIHNEEGDVLLQGNTNFIHYLDMQGHTGHVGAGHGCTVQDFTMFFADGEQFDPTTLNHVIECNYFKFTTRAKHYLIDTAQTQSSSEAVPTLDDDGNPIVTSIWTFDGEWSVNNRIKMRNQLKFVYNGIRFVQCHAGMLCGFYPDTDNVILQGSSKYIWNSTDGTNNTLEGSTDELLVEGGLTSVPADTAVLYGDTYIATQRIEQSDPNMYGKNNILANMPPNGDSRIKMYLQPCVCTSSTALTDAGMQVDVFNNGDYLDVNMLRTIDLVI